MRKYTVLKNPTTGHMKAISEGYCGWIVLLNFLLLGWVWAFANRATHLGWRLLAVTITFWLMTAAGSLVASVAGFCWPIFAITLGSVAHDRARSELRRLGF